MKKTLLALSLGCSLSLFAQDANIPCKVQKSEVFKDEYKHSTIISVDEDNNGGVVVARSFQGGMFSGGAHGYYFEHYDSGMKLVAEHEYELKEGNVLGVLVNNDKVHIIDFTYSKTDKAYVCQANTADISNFKFTTKELFRVSSKEVKDGRIGAADVLGIVSMFGSGRIDDDNLSQMIINTDKTAFAVTVDIDDKEAKKEVHRIYVYDAALNLKIDHVFKRDVKDRKFQYENIDLSKDGSTAYLLGRVKTESTKNKKEGGKYQYELTRITNADSKTQVFDTKEHYARSLKTVVKENKIACVGFYSDRKDSRFKGLCYFDMDPVTLELKTSKYSPFTEQFMIDKYGKDKDKELKNISFRDVFLTEANEIVFNAEEYYVTTHSSMGPNGSMGNTYYIYHYDDIVSAKIADNGEIVWARNINKRQSTGGDEAFISYTSMVKGDDTYFFINTGEKVKKLRNDRIQFGQKSAKKSNLNIIKINQNGDFEFKEVLDDKDNEVPFMVSDGAITKNGSSIYFIGRKGKKKQLLKLSV
ncbi:MAG TPA: hypothetical protein VEA37_07855 [Flavobacterium sp.]|nr:hypothetical protein [Flavobacterium sp.]